MASKTNKKLYRELRGAGVRKRTARSLSKGRGGGRSTAAQRQQIAGLRSAVGRLESRAGMGDPEMRTADEMLEVGSIRDVSVH